MKISIIITSYKEPKTIRKAIIQILKPNKNIWKDMELIVIAPDKKTLEAAKKEIFNYKNFKQAIILRDKARGKPAALNMAVKKTKGDIIILTDGDMYIDEKAIQNLLPYFKDKEVGGVSGHPISLDNKTSMFGFYSHLFCEAAHKQRLKNLASMTGYLYAIRNIKTLFPIPEDTRAEDAYLSYKLKDWDYKLAYAPNAKAYVYFPKNTKDWINQKTRSLGGNIQISHKRNILEDIKMFLFPISFVKTPKEILYLSYLYPLRLYLWIRIYTLNKLNKLGTGRWMRINSTKSAVPS